MRLIIWRLSLEMISVPMCVSYLAASFKYFYLLQTSSAIRFVKKFISLSPPDLDYMFHEISEDLSQEDAINTLRTIYSAPDK